MRQLFLLSMMTVSMLLSFSSPAKAQDIPDDEGVIVIDIGTNTTDPGPKRSPSIIPISANYYVLSSCLEILFLFDIGDVTVSMTNLTEGSTSSTIVDSQQRTVFIPLQEIPGLWQIHFRSSSGDSFFGLFVMR